VARVADVDGGAGDDGEQPLMGRARRTRRSGPPVMTDDFFERQRSRSRRLRDLTSSGQHTLGVDLARCERLALRNRPQIARGKKRGGSAGSST